MTTILLFYNRRKIIFYAMGFLAFGLIYVSILKDALKRDIFEIDPSIFFGIFGLLFCFTFFIFFFKMALYKGCVWKIDPEGVTHYQRGFLPWGEVKCIEFSQLNGEYNIHLRLYNPDHYFGKGMKSFFGRRQVGLAMSILRVESYNEVDQNGNNEQEGKFKQFIELFEEK